MHLQHDRVGLGLRWRAAIDQRGAGQEAGLAGQSVPLYLPSSQPRPITSGSSNRWMMSGGVITACVWRCRQSRWAMWKNDGGPPGLAFTRANTPWRY